MSALCAILTIALTYFVSAFFNRPAYFLITFFAAVIFNIEILSLFKGISGVNILILTVLEVFTAGVIWFKNKRPVLKITFPYKELKKTFVEDKTLALLGAAWLIFILTAFFLSSVCPPTEADASSYHALRALFWAKDGFISHFETSDVRNLCLPINSELFYTWILSLTGKDTCFGLLQFFSYFQLIFCQFKIMEIFKIDFKKRIWAILIFSSFPCVIIEASSTQTDLCVGALLASAIYFILEYRKKAAFHLLFFSALALSVSFGVKTTGFMAGIPVLIWFIVILKRDFIKFFLLLAGNSFIFSSYNYILNIIDFGDPFSSDSFYIYNRLYGGFKGFISNIIKYAVQFIDFTGLKLGSYFNNHILELRNTVLLALSIPEDMNQIDPFTHVNIYMHEQSGGFGILGFLVFLPCSCLGLFKKNLRIFSLLFFISFLFLCSLMAYSIFGMRYILGFSAIALPVLILSYFKKMNIIKFVIAAYALFYLGYASFYTPLRPIAYLYKEYPRGLKHIQEKLRNNEYKFFGPIITTQAGVFRESAAPLCKNGNKIGIFAPSINILYSAKYLSMNNDCKIDTLNMLHIKDYDLSDYKAIIYNSSGGQTTSAISKKDIKNPIINSYPVACAYIISDKGTKPGLRSAAEAKCDLKTDYLKKLGFSKENSNYYLHQQNDKVKVLYLDTWVK